jgi:hypothetical protein
VVILLGMCTCVTGVLAVLNAVQAILGRQILRPDSSRRSPARLRQESFATALAMSGATVAGLGMLMHWPSGLVFAALVVTIIGMSVSYVRRRRMS